MHPSSSQDVGFLRLPEVLNLIPISRSSWFEGIKNGQYPKPVKLSERCVAWRKSDIYELIEKLSKQTTQKSDKEEV